MKRESGFSLIELLVAIAILTIAVGATLSMLTQAVNTNQAVTMLADTQENLRASMNYMVRDIIQAGESVPQSGITIPNQGLTSIPPAAPPANNSAINRPGLDPTDVPTIQFFNTYTTLPAITPGGGLGYPASTPDPANPGAVLLSPTGTDIITVIYADNTLVDANNHTLNEFPIYLAKTGLNPAGCAGGNPAPAPAGTIAADGSQVTFDPSCITINAGNTALQPGDLIMFQNAKGNAIETISAVNGQTVTFGPNDLFGFNASGAPNGTLPNLQGANSPGGPYPPTSATRIWMVTYYLDTRTNPLRPQLMRQVNFHPPQAVGDVLENLTISYDVSEQGVPQVKANQNVLVWPDTESQIRKVNLYLAARSENAYTPTKQYFRNNLATEVNIRSLCFINQFR